MNKIKLQMKLMQDYVAENERTPSIEEVSELCDVKESRAQAIVRRYLIYRYIDKYTESHGFPPTRREISEMLHIPLSVTQYHIGLLSRSGLLTVVLGHARAITRLEKGA